MENHERDRRASRDAEERAQPAPDQPADAGFFDNRAFWEHRYTTDLERGSGIGSRGERLELKHRLLEEVIAELQPASILDVGCGDLEVAQGMVYDGAYTGIDLSPFIIERNQRLRPDWTFIEGDFLALAAERDLQAELVLCFDVLIHQHDPEVYRAFVGALLNAATRTVIMNGFENLEFWQDRQLPKICAFHEPLSTTLAGFGVSRAKPIGMFRGTRILRIDKIDKKEQRAEARQQRRAARVVEVE